MPAQERLERLLAQMGELRGASEPPAARERRRERVIPSMRMLHLKLGDERRAARTKRKRFGVLLVAATLAFVGTALAATQGYGPLADASPDRASVTAPVRRQPARVALRKRHVVRPVAPLHASPFPPVSAVSAVGGDGVRPSSTAASSKVAGVEPKSRSTPEADELAAVNRLFAEAKRARREHRDREALALLQALLAEYPRSMLAHEASVERFRALARLGRHAEARRYAAAYVRSYPRGFAVAEARALLSPPGP